MQAALYETFQGPISLQTVSDPTPKGHGAVIEVAATGLCRSDWHGWMGHDPDIVLPHVPGHELAGRVAAVGRAVTQFRVGDRVTVPFVCGCGSCPQCLSGNHQVCDRQTQPGFTHWGSFAEYVAIDQADINLVHLPEAISFEAAATLGCRFVTSFRAVVVQGQLSGGQFVAVHGCGGVGLSAVMIAQALGARVIAVDINDTALELATTLGAMITINSTNPVEQIKALTNGGAHLSIDALGSAATCFNSIACLRKQGRHVQVGLMTGDHQHPNIPMDRVIADELVLLGSHGMQAHKYPELFGMIQNGQLHPEQLITNTISLEESTRILPKMNQFEHPGVWVINTRGENADFGA